MAYHSQAQSCVVRWHNSAVASTYTVTALAAEFLHLHSQPPGQLRNSVHSLVSMWKFHAVDGQRRSSTLVEFAMTDAMLLAPMCN